MAEAYIVAAARTAGGKRGGRLSGWHPVDLAGQVIDGGSVSFTVTVTEQVAVLPDASVAKNVLVVVPTG